VPVQLRDQAEAEHSQKHEDRLLKALLDANEGELAQVRLCVVERARRQLPPGDGLLQRNRVARFLSSGSGDSASASSNDAVVILPPDSRPGCSRFDSLPGR
jgi:hypothetical protein